MEENKDEVIVDTMIKTSEKKTEKKKKVVKKVEPTVEKKNDKFKVYNKTYQNFGILVDGKLITLKPRGKEGFIIVESLTNQIENLKKRDLVRIVEFKE